MEILGYFNIKKPDVVHETIDGETVIVNLENGVYYSLRNSGVDVWNFLETGANYDECMSMLLDRYEGSPDEIKKSVADLLIILQKEGLVQVSSTKRSDNLAPQPVTTIEKIGYIPPVLEKFSDLQDLLLLDPIHEVDEDGWPHKIEDNGSNDSKPG